MSSNYKAVVFDFFDVVHRDHQKAWLSRHGLERTGLIAEASDQLDVGMIDAKEYLAKLAAASGQSSVEIRHQFDEFSVLDNDTVQVIRDLRQLKIRTGLLSNSSTDELHPILTKHELHQLFDEIIISGEVKLAKPDPRVFKLMLKRLGNMPGEVIFTDDNLRNIEAARYLGMHGITFRGAHHLRAELTSLGVLSAGAIA